MQAETRTENTLSQQQQPKKKKQKNPKHADELHATTLFLLLYSLHAVCHNRNNNCDGNGDGITIRITRHGLGLGSGSVPVPVSVSIPVSIPVSGYGYGCYTALHGLLYGSVSGGLKQFMCHVFCT